MRDKNTIIDWVQEQRSSTAEMIAVIELLADIRDALLHPPISIEGRHINQ